MATTLSYLTPDGEPLAPLIFSVVIKLTPKSKSVTSHADLIECFRTLIAIAPSDEVVKKAMFEMLGNPDPVFQKFALENLTKIDDHKTALPAVVRIATSTAAQARNRVIAIHLLPSLVDEKPNADVKKIVESLRLDKNPAVRAEAEETIKLLK